VPTIGVLALQGDFKEHIEALQRAGTRAREVRLPQELDEVEGLIIPGGESTTIGTLMRVFRFGDKIKALASRGFPIWGTCAGMIVIAKQIVELKQESLNLIGIDVRRNAFGRQVDSFETDLTIPSLGKQPFRAVFIRAPWIERTGQKVEVMATLADGTPVAARQENIIVTSFHPELTEDQRFHRHFVQMAMSTRVK
jgi:5'-phosphate synthase pdxT subunit